MIGGESTCVGVDMVVVVDCDVVHAGQLNASAGRSLLRETIVVLVDDTVLAFRHSRKRVLACLRFEGYGSSREQENTPVMLVSSGAALLARLWDHLFPVQNDGLVIAHGLHTFAAGTLPRFLGTTVAAVRMITL